MTDLLLFHHALGLTDGCRSFAGRVRTAGHEVHTPDLYEGKTFSLPDYDRASAELAAERIVGFRESV